jgi:hypothetical protein
MTDRLVSALSAFDLLVITLAGGLVIAGVWWGIDGVPAEAPSAAGLVGLVAASYVAGHLVGAVSGVVWRRERDPAKHPWTRAFSGALGDHDGSREHTPEPKRSWGRWFAEAFGRAEARSGRVDMSPTDERFREAFEDIRELPVLDQVELIRTVLRQRRLDTRFETMNTTAWVSRSLATAAGVLAVVFIVLAVLDGDYERRLPAAVGAAMAAFAFEVRARGYQRNSAQALKYEALALVQPPDAFSPATPERGPTSNQSASPEDADLGAGRSNAEH